MSTTQSARKKQETTPSRLKFAKTLVKRRKERGYVTAYAFFHKNGAKPHFGFSYLHYLFIERGLRLPGREGLRAILDTMGRAAVYPEERRELLELYLKALTDGDSLFDLVFVKPAPAAETAGAKSETVDETMLRLVSSRHISGVPRMSMQQIQALMASPAHFWTFYRLSQTGQRKSAAHIASELGCKEAEVQAASEALMKAKLLERTKGGGLSCPHFESDIFEPIRSMDAERVSWLDATISSRVRAVNDRHYFNAFILALEDPEQVAAIVKLYRQFMSKVYMFRPATPVSRGNLIAIEGRISSVLKID